MFYPSNLVKAICHILVHGYCSVNEEHIPEETHEEPGWGRYARGALYALQRKGHHLSKVEEASLFSFIFSFLHFSYFDESYGYLLSVCP